MGHISDGNGRQSMKGLVQVVERSVCLFGGPWHTWDQNCLCMEDEPGVDSQNLQQSTTCDYWGCVEHPDSISATGPAYREEGHVLIW